MLKSIALCRRSLSGASPQVQGAKVPSKRVLSSKPSRTLATRFSKPQHCSLHHFGCRSYANGSPPSEIDDMPPILLDDLEPEPIVDRQLSELDKDIPSLGEATAPLLAADNSTNQTMQSAKPAFQGQRSQTLRPQRSNPVNGQAPGTFVSNYYKIDEANLTSYLNRKHIAFKQNSSRQLVLRDCPFCHDTKAHPTNLWKLYIYMENGNYFCFRCSAQGSWYAHPLKPSNVLF